MVRHRLSYCRYVAATRRYVSRQDGRTVKIGVAVRFHDGSSNPAGRQTEPKTPIREVSLVLL